MLLFFFFKQKTAYEMRISDWSSDVCASALQREAASSGRGDRRFHMGISLRDAIRRPASAAPGTEHCALRRRGSHDYARRSASLYRRPHWEAAVAGPEWGSSSWFPAHGRSGCGAGRGHFWTQWVRAVQERILRTNWTRPRKRSRAMAHSLHRDAGTKIGRAHV